MYTFMVAVVNVLFWFVLISGNMCFFFIYWLNLPFFEKYKSVDEPWPWETDKNEWNKLFKRSMTLTILNATVVAYIIAAPNLNCDTPLPFSDDDDIPTTLNFLLQILFCNMVENISFYFAHRLLHKPFLYKYIHKIHHEHKVTTSLATISTHPLEYIFGNVVPS